MSLASSLQASFCWKGLHKLQEVESKNTKDKPWLLHVGASSKGLSPAFYSHKGLYWRKTCDATVAAFTDAFKDAIMQIFHTVKSHVKQTVKSRTSRVLFPKLFPVQSV